jgi:hypothetical protein
MIYHILIVANDIYFKLLELCVKSILQTCDLDKIKSIFIADLGLSQSNKNILSSLNTKITILNTNIAISDSDKIHSEGWVDAVSQKTNILAGLIKENNIPIVMMDSDMIVIEDFSCCIDLKSDIQICQRSMPLTRPDGLIVNHIASFFITNTQKGLFFVYGWINRMKERIALNMFPPHETPAMVEVLAMENRCTIGFLQDKIVSCENNYIENVTKIIHAKGRTRKDSISIFRFTNINHFPFKRTFYLFRRNEKILFIIVFIYKKIFNFYGLKKHLSSLKQKIKLHIL